MAACRARRAAVISGIAWGLVARGLHRTARLTSGLSGAANLACSKNFGILGDPSTQRCDQLGGVVTTARRIR